MQASVHAEPASDARRARLARLLLSSDTEACQGVLQPAEGELHALAGETLVLDGLATALSGQNNGLERVQKALHLAPWDDEAWQALAYLRMSDAAEAEM